MNDETIGSDKHSSGTNDSRREQSTISFPYLDLDAAIDVARAIYNRSGLGSCDLDELAAEMNQTMSGAFRQKTGTAKTFDLVDKDGKSSIKLSALGRQIISGDTERAARAEAFMRVPLYAAIYEKYKGHLLPPTKALEREMQALGVSSKQTDKARQAFERSAKQAYFFESGEDRLVRPRIELDQNRHIGRDDSLQDGDLERLSGVSTTPIALPPPPPVTEKALEYKLVDLMSDALDKPDVMQAIITVVTFLKSREAAKARNAGVHSPKQNEPPIGGSDVDDLIG